MSNPPTPKPVNPFDFSPGLVAYYSSQATLMLSQYQNIERLLGPTNDWTAPGTHCEVLLRDFLRSHLPSYYRVDKGFVYERRPVGNDTAHCPEIDLLVHNNHDYRPIIQIEDFVIVQGKAAHAAIQVKRRMNKRQLTEALENVRDARVHVGWACRDVSRNPFKFFSGVVFFDKGKPRNRLKPSKTYRNCIEELFSDPSTWEFAPEFIGSLQHHFYRRSSNNINQLNYAGYPAFVNGQNIAVQFLLWTITHIISRYGTQPPMTVPPMMTEHKVDDIEIAAPTATASGKATNKGGQP